MKLEIQKRYQIDDKKWNVLIEKSTIPCIYATTWFLDEINSGWEAIVLVQDDDYQFVMPVSTRQKFGFRYVVQPIYCQFLGIFGLENNEEINQYFLSFFLSKYKNILRYAFNPKQKFEGLQSNYTHLLLLDKPIGNHDFVQIKKGKKGRLQAQKHGWKITKTTSLENVIAIFKANHEARIGNVSERAYDTLRKLHNVAGSKQNVVVFEATSPETNQVEGGALFWNFGGRLIYQFCSATPFGQRREARRAILLHVIEAFANQGFILDFETTNEEGFRWFHLSFGAEEVYFPVLEMQNVSWAMRILKKIREWLN